MTPEHIDFLLSRQEFIYTTYSERLKKIIAFLEIEFRGHPIPVLKDIWHIHNLLAACFEDEIWESEGKKGIESLLDYTEETYAKAIAKCYNYSIIEYGKRVARRYNWAKLFGNLKSVNDGEFYKEYENLRKLAKVNFEKGENYFKNKNFNECYDPYENALDSFIKLDKLFDKHLRRINRSVWNGIIYKVIFAVFAIILLLKVLLR